MLQIKSIRHLSPTLGRFFCSLIGTFSLSVFCASADNYSGYWHQGKAEISRYQLEQARYGEMRDGNAVLIFVSEDFSKRKQVKLDDPLSAGDDREPILKLNMSKKFITGIYPYSMFMSVFTPAKMKDDKSRRSLKVTASIQEWCGNTFSQFNFRDAAYQYRIHSYFEDTGDISGTITNARMEDELWTHIRLNPNTLPIGEVDMIPGVFYQRLKHISTKKTRAIISKTRLVEGKHKTIEYSVHYPTLQRTLTIFFEEIFPHTIVKWVEEYSSGWGKNKKTLRTVAIKKETMMIDYWNKNSNKDSELRQVLGLP